MRRVAAFQAMRIDASAELFEGVKSVIKAWVADKFEERGGATVVRRSGRAAQCELVEDQLDAQVRLRLTTLEEVEDGSGLQFETASRALLDGGRLYLRTEVFLGQGQGYLGGARGTARAPKFFGEIVALPGHWFFDERADRILGRVFQVKADADLLVQVLSSEERRLPMILVSSVEGRERHEGLSKALARVTTGLAHVAVLDEGASWALTGQFGEKWSCYGQAARVFWPRRFNKGSPYDHPLHLASRMPDTCAAAVDRIVQPLIEASTLIGGYPALDRFERDLGRRSLDVHVAPSQEDEDYKRLAEDYARDNDKLRADNDRLRAENEDLRARVEAAAVKQEPAEQVETLATVVADFQARHQGLLAFADDWERQVRSINPDGFGPGELERSLDLLVEMAQALRASDGSLGKQTSLWCRDRGHECSADSETDRNATAHEWRVEGCRETFNLHLKPTDGTAPDRCIRIYFKTGRDPWRVIVGFIGSKAGLQ